jgi:energy-coupling factor transporter ATP-binding protein EcfA2
MKSMNGSSWSSLEEGDDIREEEAKFKPNSCIMVVGTTGRGKTTTMNLFTGNKEMIARKGQTAAITRKEKLCPDLKHQSSNPAQIWPEWMDTEGLDAAGAKHDNEKLLRRYLKELKDSNKKWIHAIIWCITPEPKEDTRLSEQARFISMFENEERERSIWENVIILARKGFNDRNDEGFQGALAAVPNNFKDTVQCIGYNLDRSQPGAISEERARKILEKAIRHISEPVSLFFRNEVCIDCGQRGDRRLMTNECHLMKFEPTRLPGKKKVCSQCKECSYRIICGYPWRFTPAKRCVGWGNHVPHGLTVAPPEKTQHELSW